MRLARAEEILATEIQPNGGLYSLGWYLHWTPGDQAAVLDGDFTADQLEAIATFMREKHS